MSPQIRLITKLAAGILSFVAIYLVLLMIAKKYGIDASDIKHFVESLGIIGIFVLTLLMGLSVMSPFPDSPTALIANILYGPILGFFIVLFGSFLGAYMDFIIVRKIGRKFIRKRFPVTFENINRIAKKIGFEAMVFLRIFPTVTFDIVSYTAAISKVKVKLFLIATLIGLLPLAITYSIIGNGLESQDGRKILISLILGLSLISVVIFVSKYFEKQLNLNKLEEDDIIS